jgi:hypothetical protein
MPCIVEKADRGENRRRKFSAIFLQRSLHTLKVYDRVTKWMLIHHARGAPVLVKRTKI